MDWQSAPSAADGLAKRAELEGPAHLRAQVSGVGVELELLLVGVAAERGGERIGRLPDVLHDLELDLGGQLGEVEYFVGEARVEEDFGGG